MTARALAIRYRLTVCKPSARRKLGKKPRYTGAARHRPDCSSRLLLGVPSDNLQRPIDQHQRRLVLKEYKANVASSVAGDARLDRTAARQRDCRVGTNI